MINREKAEYLGRSEEIFEQEKENAQHMNLAELEQDIFEKTQELGRMLLAAALKSHPKADPKAMLVCPNCKHRIRIQEPRSVGSEGQRSKTGHTGAIQASKELHVRKVDQLD